MGMLKEQSKKLFEIIGEVPQKEEIHDEEKFSESGNSERSDTAKQFSPKEELARIRKFPSKERREAVHAWKELYTMQMEGIAAIQELIISAIRRDPDISYDQIEGLITPYKKAFQLNPDQWRKIAEIIFEYENKHKAVRHVKKEIKDPEKIFNYVFSRSPQGRVDVIEGPMTLYFRCYDLNDYAYIYSQAFMNGRDVTKEELEIAQKSGGVSVPSSFRPDLQGTLIAENSASQEEWWSKLTHTHEEQHAIKRLFFESRRTPGAWAILPTQELISSSPAERGYILARYFHWLREGAEMQVKDELLAYLKEGGHAPKKIYDILTEQKMDGGLYEYNPPEDINQKANDIISSIGEQYRHEVLLIAYGVLRKEYHRLIRNGIDSFLLLEQGYGTESALSFCINEPLAKWPKIARRLLEQKKKKDKESVMQEKK